jgi:hypothetical protein
MVRNRFIANKYPQISEGMLTDSNNYNFTDPNVQLQNSAKKKDIPTNWQVK